MVRIPGAFPAMQICPSEGTKSPHKSLISVDLPLPFGPNRPMMRPAGMSKSRWSSAVFLPYRLVRLRTDTRLSEESSFMMIPPPFFRIKAV